MPTTKERQKRLDEKANAAGVLSNRQARARHAQIARNYFNSNPTIGNLYHGTVNWLQSKGIITPEGTGLITGVAPAAGRGKTTLPSRRKAAANLRRSGKNVQAKPSTNTKQTSNSKPSTNTSTNSKSRYVKPSNTLPTPRTTSEGLRNRVNPNRGIQLPQNVVNRLQQYNLDSYRAGRPYSKPRTTYSTPRQSQSGLYVNMDGRPTAATSNTVDLRSLTRPKTSRRSSSRGAIPLDPRQRAKEIREAFSQSEQLDNATIGALAGLGAFGVGVGSVVSMTAQRNGSNKSKDAEEKTKTATPINTRRSARGMNATITDALRQTVADARTRYANIPQATPQPSRNESESNTTPANSVENTGSNQRGSRRYLDSTPTISRKYTIRRGDTLSNIARRNGTTVAQLARDNGITDVNRIIAGQTLQINEGKRKSNSSKSKRSASKSSTRTRRPTINRADVAANTYNNDVPSVAPAVASVNVPYSPEEELLRLRGQYRRGGRVR